jgi:hypothetical protein
MDLFLCDFCVIFFVTCDFLFLCDFFVTCDFYGDSEYPASRGAGAHVAPSIWKAHVAGGAVFERRRWSGI